MAPLVKRTARRANHSRHFATFESSSRVIKKLGVIHQARHH